jgi:hypothetical protein
MPNYIGEAVSSSIPSAIVFFQNIPNNEHFCKKNNESLVESNDLKLNFSVSNYFGLNGLLIIAYLIAFIFIDRRKLNKKSTKLIISTELEEDRTESEEFIKQLNKKKEFSVEKFFLLSIIFLLCLLMYGVLPGIQTFSTLPYGDLEFNLSINLGNVILPLAIVLSIFTNDISLKRVYLEFLVGGIFSGYLSKLISVYHFFLLENYNIIIDFSIYFNRKPVSNTRWDYFRICSISGFMDFSGMHFYTSPISNC